MMGMWGIHYTFLPTFDMLNNFHSKFKNWRRGGCHQTLKGWKQLNNRPHETMGIYTGAWRRQNCGTWNFFFNAVVDSEWVEDSRKEGCGMWEIGKGKLEVGNGF